RFLHWFAAEAARMMAGSIIALNVFERDVRLWLDAPVRRLRVPCSSCGGRVSSRLRGLGCLAPFVLLLAALAAPSLWLDHYGSLATGHVDRKRELVIARQAADGGWRRISKLDVGFEA